ncbi:MAG: hypothetical protein O7A06_05900 [Acidobacteria bacterium]|nr:hypothetical protein [Acidobacteriota bacterium]MCZ6751182.1 hypothetical protein [Acidobacteriota bacterium]
MALSEKQMLLIEEGVRLALAAVLAAVQASGDEGEIDWNSVRITETPEMALAKARRRENRNQESGVRSQNSE